MISHGKLDLSYFFGGAENCVDLLHISVAEIAEENNLPRVLEKYVCLGCLWHLLNLSPKTVPNMSVYGPDYHFQGNGWTLADVTSFSCIL